MESNFLLPLVGIIFLWLFIITVILYKILTHYNQLAGGLKDKSFKSILENIVNGIAASRKDIDYLKSYCDKIQKDSLLHIQKIGLVRFNPFKDTGGDQSFILSLMDANDTGVIISGLYSRSGTRWYAKKIVKGKALEYELSDEEKRALREAKSL